MEAAKNKSVSHALVLGMAALTILSSQVLFLASGTRQELPALEEDIQVLFIGDSTVRQVGSRTVGVPALNLAAPILNYELERVLVESWLDRLDGLRVVVVGLRSLNLYRDSVEERQGDYLDLTTRGVPWWRLPGGDWMSRIVQGLAGPPGGYFEHWVERDLRVQRFAPQALHEYPLTAAEGARGVRRYGGWFHEGPVLQRNLDHYAGLLDELRFRGLHVVMLKMPTTMGFARAKTEVWLAAEEQLVQIAAERGAQTWDLHAALGLEESMFLDPVHLDEPGRVLVRAELGRRLRTLLADESHESE